MAQASFESGTSRSEVLRSAVAPHWFVTMTFKLKKRLESRLTASVLMRAGCIRRLTTMDSSETWSCIVTRKDIAFCDIVCLNTYISQTWTRVG